VAPEVAKITIRIDPSAKRRFLATLVLNGDTIQSVLSQAVADYLAKHADNASETR